jgi:hypothetical protein
MRAGFRLLSLMIVPLAVFAAAVPASHAGDRQVLRKALAKEPFKDLPGVRLPQKFDDEPKSVCTSHIARDRWADFDRAGRYRTGLGHRVYTCGVDGMDNVTIESTRQPDEVDWKKQKRYYKPWIDDGFDR